MRKLATIRKITNIQPIPGADNIEVATVGGWKVVIAKNVGHQVGDLVIYCEIDSFLPIEPEFEFLRKSSYKKMADDSEGFRLRTAKLRGQVSQGLIIPLTDAYQIFQRNFPNLTMEWFENLEVTEMLNITKYEPPIPAQLEGKVKGGFPSFVPKTDEERVQNLVGEYEDWKESDYEFYVTEKLDGTSATFYLNHGEFGICSRNWELAEDDENTLWRVAKEMKIVDILRTLNSNVAIQGELIGEGIQGNRYKVKGQTVRFFNMYDIDTRIKVVYDEFMNIMSVLGFPTVPILFTPGKFKLPESIDDILMFAEDKSQLNRLVEREGVVIRSRDNTISFKVISNKFLLKGGE